MTPIEYAAKLRSQLDELERNNAPFKLAVSSTVAKSAVRIFTDGQNDNGQKFTYSKGYAKIRADKGRRTDFVNFQFIGDLKSDYENTAIGSSSEKAKPIQVDVNHYITALKRDENVTKYNALQEPGRTNKKTGNQRKAYGQFLELNESEIQEFYTINEKELALFLSK